MVSYEKDKGAILNWSGGYSGTIDSSIKNYLNFNTLENTGNMDNNAAYFSNQTFRIGAKTVKVRVYYAGGGPFKDALDKWTLQLRPMKTALSIRFRIIIVLQKQRMDSPIIHLEKTKKFDNFIYVSPTAVLSDQG